MTTAPCQFLPWDSEFFGVRVGRVTANQLNQEQAQAIDQWCAEHRIDCLYLLADSDHAETVRIAEDSGFRFQDIRTTLTHSALDSLPPVKPTTELQFRTGIHSDLDAFNNTVRSIYIHSRFYYDPCFTEQKCAELYAVWLANSFKESNGDRVMVAELAGKPVGYVSCIVSETGIGTIGLVGIAPEAQGKHIGTQLVNASLHWFADHGMHTVEVVTQGRNIAALRIYQRCGFLISSTKLWYHKWFQNCMTG